MIVDHELKMFRKLVILLATCAASSLANEWNVLKPFHEETSYDSNATSALVARSLLPILEARQLRCLNPGYGELGNCVDALGLVQLSSLVKCPNSPGCCPGGSACVSVINVSVYVTTK